MSYNGRMKFCNNCGRIFRTGLFPEEQKVVKKHPDSEESKNLLELYDEVCPYCGCYPPATFLEWLEHWLWRIKLHK